MRKAKNRLFKTAENGRSNRSLIIPLGQFKMDEDNRSLFDMLLEAKAPRELAEEEVAKLGLAQTVSLWKYVLPDEIPTFNLRPGTLSILRRLTGHPPLIVAERLYKRRRSESTAITDAHERATLNAILPPLEAMPSLSELASVLTAPLPQCIPVDDDDIPQKAGLTVRSDDKLCKLQGTLWSCLNMFSTGSQDNLHALYDTFIKLPIFSLGKEIGLSIEADRTVSDISGFTQASMRPNVLVWLNGALLLKAEEETNDMGKAKQDLVSKCNPWVPQMFQLPYVLCYAAKQSSVEFYALSPSNMLTHLAAFELSLLLDRLSVVQFSLNILRLFRTIDKLKLIPHFLPSVGKVIRRGKNVTILIDADYVVKTVPDGNVDFFNELYGIVNSIPFAIKGVVTAKRSGGVHIRLEPLCLPNKRPLELKQLWSCLEAIVTAITALHGRGYVHRDLRWENILYTNQHPHCLWLVSDFENAVPVSTVDDTYMPSSRPPDSWLTQGWSPACDWYQLGQMLQQTNFNDERTTAFRNSLLKGSFNPDDFLTMISSIETSI
eukprot:GILJ01006437.1.p1 GENE.GILJ01006437.1~~GILJ01006437.1.p1  ORF type:complete len:548 (-),score=29.30 GILJ01006437.1:185-1828(-)